MRLGLDDCIGAHLVFGVGDAAGGDALGPAERRAVVDDGFRVGVIVMFPDLEKQSVKTEAVYFDIMSLKEKVEPVPVEFQIPPGAKSFLVFVRLDGCGNGELNGNLAGKGMRMVEAGKVISYLCPT